MKAQAFIFVALVLVSSVLAEEHMMSREETKEVAHNEIKGRLKYIFFMKDNKVGMKCCS